MIYTIVVVVILACLVGFVYYYGIQIQRILEGFDIPVKRFYCNLFTGILCFMLIAGKSIFVVALAYSCVLFLLADIMRLLLRLMDKQGTLRTKLSKLYAHGIPILVFAAICSLYSAYNARVSRVTEYQISVDKQMEEDIQVIFVADTHVGTSVKKEELDKLVKQVNALQGDVICLGGDIFDESSTDELIAYACEAFAGMEAEHGVYYISGNHDKKRMSEFRKYFEEAGIQILDDEVALVDERFYLVGRMDLGMEGETVRRTMEDLLSEVEPEYPVVLLDHRPTTVEEGIGTCVDLQLSGHTHGGQIYPGNILVDIFNDVGYGMKVYDDLHVIVSSGYGSWGFPVRIGSHNEILNVIIQGKNREKHSN